MLGNAHFKPADMKVRQQYVLEHVRFKFVWNDISRKKFSQQKFTCSMSRKETLEKYVIYV